MGACNSDTRETTREEVMQPTAGKDHQWKSLSEQTLGLEKLQSRKLSTAETCDAVGSLPLNKCLAADSVHDGSGFKPIKASFIDLPDCEDDELHPEFFDQEMKLMVERCQSLEELAKAMSPFDFEQNSEEGGLRIIFDSIDDDSDGLIDAKDLAKAISLVFDLGPAGASDIMSTEALMELYQESGNPCKWDFIKFKTFMLKQASVE